MFHVKHFNVTQLSEGVTRYREAVTRKRRPFFGITRDSVLSLDRVRYTERMSDRMDAIMQRLKRQRNDDHGIEAKSGSGKLDKGFWSTVSAFANTDGGLIVLGVEEDQKLGTFRANPDFDPRLANDRLISGFSEGQEKPPVTPLPRARIETDEIEGAPVILVEIFPMRGDSELGRHMPCYVTSQGLAAGAYKRVLDGDKRLSSYEVFQLRTLYEPDYSDREPVPGAVIDDLNPTSWTNLIDSFVKSGSRLTQGTSNNIEVLERLRVVDREGTPTMAGLLALGVYPQQFFPQLFIDVTVHPSRAKASSPTRFLDRVRCDGPMPVAIEDALNAVVRNLRTRSVEQGSKMIDEPEIPGIVLREAIVNAVMHRDYSPQVQGRQVQVDVYPDRVEIKNPGGLWGDRTLQNLDEPTSMSRNEALANLLSHLPTPGGSFRVAENQGSGIQRMKAGMRGHGLPQPVFEAGIGEFTVILQRFGLLTPDIAGWVRTFAPDADHQQQVALAIAHGLGAVSVKNVRENLGIDSDDARELLRGLASKGMLSESAVADSFSLPRGQSGLDGTDLAILQTLSKGEERSARDLADAVGITVAAIRPRLRRLVEGGEVAPTASPTSRNRKYRLP